MPRPRHEGCLNPVADLHTMVCTPSTLLSLAIYKEPQVLFG